MRITPLDIQQQKFNRTMRGYETRAVDGFLELVAGEMESLVRELHTLQDKSRLFEKQSLDFQERERILKETLVTAQKMTSDIKVSAEKESELVINRAEMQADKIINMAYQRLAKIIDDINELKRQRARMESDIQSVVDSHARLLQAMTESRQEEPAPEDVIKIMNKG